MTPPGQQYAGGRRFFLPAGHFGDRLRRLPAGQRWINRVDALLFLALALRLVFVLR